MQWQNEDVFTFKVCNRVSHTKTITTLVRDENRDNFSFFIYMLFFFKNRVRTRTPTLETMWEAPDYTIRALTPLHSPPIDSFQFPMPVTLSHDYWSEQ